jgi:hypothetical protein
MRSSNVPPLFLPEYLAIEMLDLDDPALKEYLRIRDAEMSITFNRQVEEHVYRRTMELQQQIQDRNDGTLTLSRQQEQSRKIALEEAAHRIIELETLLHGQTLSNVAPSSELNDVQNADKWVSAFHLYPNNSLRFRYYAKGLRLRKLPMHRQTLRGLADRSQTL